LRIAEFKILKKKKQEPRVQGLKINGIRHQALGKEKLDFNDFT
jgi:hypothetical protein